MAEGSVIDSGADSQGAAFRTTLWTEVVQAGDAASPAAAAALSRLCQTYWRPVYAFIRKKGHTREAAEDLVQGFFERFLEKNHAARADRERGRFRSFLMTSVENYLRDVHQHATRLKRGGGAESISIDAMMAEEAMEEALTDPMDPALAFDRLWANTVLEHVRTRLQAEYVEVGKGPIFEHLQPHLWGDSEAVPYAALAPRLGLTAVHLRVMGHRLRQRFRELLHEEIAQTVAQPAETDAEIQHLLLAVSGR